MKTTLVIMAAGMGSRYGGNKQTDGIGPHGEILMEYSIYDALRAGFRKVVFIIKPDMRRAMEERVSGKVRGFRTPEGDTVEVAYAYQDFSSIPEEYLTDRVKPFGTGHALLCAAEAVEEPFCVINADDYYGVDAYRVMREELCRLPERERKAAGKYLPATMVGYVLKNTVSSGGSVSRGICQVEEGILRGVTERLTIVSRPDGSCEDEDSGVRLSPEDIVSMNLWGFTPSIFRPLREHFTGFLRTSASGNPKAECQLPVFVNREMEAGRLTVSVLRSRDAWFGMTYQEDRRIVAERLRELHGQGLYPERLWD